MVDTIWLSKSSGLIIKFQPHPRHSPVNFFGCTRQIGQNTKLVSCHHYLDPYVAYYRLHSNIG